MSDQDSLDTFMETLRSSAPGPDPDARERAISMAVRNFSERHQELPDALRQNEYRQGERVSSLMEGLTKMKNRLKAVLVGSTAIATTMVGVFAVFTLQTDNQDTSFTGVTDIVENDLVVERPAIMEDFADSSATMELREAVNITNPAPMQKLVTTGRKMPVGDAASGALASSPLMAQSEMIEMPIAPYDDQSFILEEDRSRFEGEEIEAVKLVSEEPVSTFSIDVDTASYAHTRRMIESGVIPSPDSIRIEEMLNYFPYSYAAPAPDADHPFATDVSVFEAPWNTQNQLVRIGIQGVMPEIEARPALDLVFLIDTSGSMNAPDKLGLLKKSLIMMLSELREEDRIGIVTYAGSAGVVLEMTPASEVEEIMAALASLNAGGSTAGAAGLEAAYGLLAQHRGEDRIGRVLLATDGDFNVGMSSNEEMKSFIEDQRDDGSYLSVLGFGTGNYNDGLMQTLAQNGNGTAAYIDNLSEARKVLVDQLSGALFPIANDVKIQVEWNPKAVSEYRLIGYETRALRREDFNNDKVDAGEIGAGHQVTALYEITQVGSEGGMISPSRYQTVEEEADQSSDELGYVNIRYKHPGEAKSVLLGTPIIEGGEVDADARFAASIAGFGQLMKDDRYLGDWSYADAAELAGTALGNDRFGYRHEAVKLMQLMEVLPR